MLYCDREERANDRRESDKGERRYTQNGIEVERGSMKIICTGSIVREGVYVCTDSD